MDLNQLGALLHERREAAGLSLEEVVERTKISRRVLDSIEHGRAEDLPHPVYTKGFIRNYASVLGLDLNEINASLTKIFPVENEESEEAALEVQRDVKLHVGRNGKGTRLLTAAVVLAVLVSAVILFIWLLPGGNGERQRIELPAPSAPVEPGRPAEQPAEPSGLAPSDPQPESPAETPVSPTAPETQTPTQAPAPETSLRQSSGTATAQAAVVMNERPVPAAPETVESPATPQPGVLVVTAVERCWFEIVVDGKSAVEYFLQPGERLTTEYGSGLMLRVGNAGGITLVHNGSPVSFEAGSGDVKTFTFP